MTPSTRCDRRTRAGWSLRSRSRRSPTCSPPSGCARSPAPRLISPWPRRPSSLWWCTASGCSPRRPPPRASRSSTRSSTDADSLGGASRSTIGFEQWFSTRIFYLIHALNLLVIVATRDFPADAKWPLLAAALILSLLVTSVFAAARPQVAQRIAVVVGGLRFWRPRPSRDDRRASGARLHADAMAVVGRPRHRAIIAAISAASVLADAACFWMLLFAVGIHDGFELALLSVGAAAVASSIPLLPGGLGAVEAAVPALLAWYGAPVAAALSATLLYRAIGTFLPAAGGALSIPALRIRARRVPTGHGHTTRALTAPRVAWHGSQRPPSKRAPRRAGPFDSVGLHPASGATCSGAYLVEGVDGMVDVESTEAAEPCGSCHLFGPGAGETEGAEAGTVGRRHCR